MSICHPGASLVERCLLACSYCLPLWKICPAECWPIFFFPKIGTVYRLCYLPPPNATIHLCAWPMVLVTRLLQNSRTFIPTLDNTGLVEDYESLYPSNWWHEPVSSVKTSEMIEEATLNALSHGFTYLMDECDNEWLNKNNEEACGEGTLAQGAISTCGTTTRTSKCSAKAKGKETDIAQPIVILEDEFELAMGLFGKVMMRRLSSLLHHICCHITHSCAFKC